MTRSPFGGFASHNHLESQAGDQTSSIALSEVIERVGHEEIIGLVYVDGSLPSHRMVNVTLAIKRSLAQKCISTRDPGCSGRAVERF
jgi:hypothetical protein